MTYGEQKIKDITEGILPATRNAARAARKERRRIHKTARSRARMQQLAGDDGSLATTLERHEVVQQMHRRRQADNLSGLFRWAERTTRHLADPEDRYLAVKAVLPDNLIGRHALSHIAHLDGFREPGDDDRSAWRREGRRAAEAARTTRREEAHRRRTAVLADLVLLDLAAVNRWLKANATCTARPAHGGVRVCDCRPRLIAGIHDVQAFAEAVPEQADAVIRALASR